MKYFCCRSRRTIKENYRETEKAVLDSILGKGYDKRIRPSGQNITGKTKMMLFIVFNNGLTNGYLSDFLKIHTANFSDFKQKNLNWKVVFLLNLVMVSDHLKLWRPFDFWR